jgi:Flp pilus assembly pilin Flp
MRSRLLAEFVREGVHGVLGTNVVGAPIILEIRFGDSSQSQERRTRKILHGNLRRSRRSLPGNRDSDVTFVASTLRPFNLSPTFRTMEKPGGLIRQHIKNLCSDTQGQDVAEYAVMLAVILVIVIGVVRMIGSNASTVFSQVGSAIQ